MKRLLVLFLFVCASALPAQQHVTTPKEQFGYDIGADYVLPNYQAFSAYWHKLDAESDRMVVQSIGKTAEGRDQLMAIVTSPANQAKLAHYQEIARRLALAQGLTAEQAHALADEGKAIVWIDGGLHATEVLGAQQLMETVYQLVSRDDPETRRILDDVIVLAVHANPDGHDLVADWYMRTPDAKKRLMDGVPRLYEKYAGHDNNRDSYMNALPETKNMSRVQFREWFPQIVYNHHQTGPSGSVLFAPPFRDPFNYNMDPLIPAQIDAVGAAMHSRFIAENKPGAVTRRGTGYSTWWNGGLRTTVYFHNMIGLLTESIGNPTPVEIPFVPRFQLPSSDVFMPIAPQKEWHFRQSIDYSVTANYAVLDFASRNREHLLFDIYRMGRNSIERGSRDNWTAGAWDLARITSAAAADSASNTSKASQPASAYERSVKYFDLLHSADHRDPRGYIISADQRDFLTATKFVNALIESGITVMRARSAFTVAGKSYPAGSYVIKAAQPFRPHVIDMFEPQQHPNDFQYPGGPPIPPYDNAGYTLAYQMGVQFHRILDGFDGPFDTIADVLAAPAGRVTNLRAKPDAYVFSHNYNDAFTVVNRLLASGYEVSSLREAAKLEKHIYPVGTFAVKAKPGLEPTLQKLARETGVSFEGVGKIKHDARLSARRIALWDQYGGSSTSGWIRYIFDTMGFAYNVVYPPDVDAGNLRAKYDVLILPSGSLGSERAFGRSTDSLLNVPAEWKARMGRYTRDKTLPQLQEFVEQGGTIITIGNSTRLAYDLKVPIEDALTRADSAGRSRALRNNEFYVPGSVLAAKVDTTSDLAVGLPDNVFVFFDESPAFRVTGDVVHPVAWYEKEPLRSGWAWGQKYLENAVAIADTRVGQGRLILFGPEITFRSQPHGTYKFLFNAIYY